MIGHKIVHNVSEWTGLDRLTVLGCGKIVKRADQGVVAAAGTSKRVANSIA